MQGPPHSCGADPDNTVPRQALGQFRPGDVRMLLNQLFNMRQHIGGDARRRATALFISSDPAGVPDLAKQFFHEPLADPKEFGNLPVRADPSVTRL